MIDVRVVFEPDQSFHVVLVGEAFDVSVPVFPNPAREIIRHTSIQRSISLRGENIDEVIMLSHSRTIQEQLLIVIPELLHRENIRDPAVKLLGPGQMLAHFPG